MKSVGGTITFLVFKKHTIEAETFSRATEQTIFRQEKFEERDRINLPRDAELVDYYFEQPLKEDCLKLRKYTYTMVYEITRERILEKGRKIIVKDFDNIPADAVIKNIKDAQGKYIDRNPNEDLK